jgi:hypothetical protein
MTARARIIYLRGNSTAYNSCSNLLAVWLYEKNMLQLKSTGMFGCFLMVCVVNPAAVRCAMSSRGSVCKHANNKLAFRLAVSLPLLNTLFVCAPYLLWLYLCCPLQCQARKQTRWEHRIQRRGRRPPKQQLCRSYRWEQAIVSWEVPFSWAARLPPASL